MIEWPQELVGDIARRRCVLFLGAGISKNSLSSDGSQRPPDWAEFLGRGLDQFSGTKKHIKSLLSQHDYLTACEIIKVRMGENWHNYVHDQFVNPRFQPSEIHKHIFRLDCRIVLTQNIDKVYDTYASHESQNTVYVKAYDDEDVARMVRGNRRCILKAHGSVDTVAKMIFSREDYSNARYRYSQFYSLLDALVLTHTFLFLGCGLTDPDVRLMLERHAQMFPDSRPHMMVMPSKAIHSEIKDCLCRNLNLSFLNYSAGNDHQELCDSIAELAGHVEACREELVNTRDW